LLTPNQKHQRAASSDEFVEMIDDDRSVLERIVMKAGVSCTIQKQTSECNLVESKETESSQSENAKIAGENNVDCIF
jgi:hypothetical protein